MYFVIIIRFDYEILYRDKCYEKRNLYSINQFRHDLLEYFWKNIKSTRPKISFRVVYIVGNHRHKNWNGSFFNWTPGNISTSCLNWLKKKKNVFYFVQAPRGLCDFLCVIELKIVEDLKVRITVMICFYVSDTYVK